MSQQTPTATIHGTSRGSSLGRDVQAAGAARTSQTEGNGGNLSGAQAAGAARVTLDPTNVHTTNPDACKCCNSIVNWSSLALQCDGCNKWTHKQCLNMSNSEYQRLEGLESIWLCNNCGFNNIHPSIFSNQNSSLNDSSFTIDLTNSPGPPPFSSSPTRPARKPHQQTQLRIINVNCQSVLAKRFEFNHMIESVNPDIVIGTESWLHSNITNNSVFPTSHYTVYRKDRESRGGGVFILVRDTLQSTREEELETECEILWCKINIKNRKTLHIGAYYRPHESDEESTKQLDTSIKRINSTNGLVILGGDFNTPGWDWNNMRPKENCRVTSIYENIIESLDDNGLQQVINFPTRGQNTLDLICTNVPGRIGNQESLPGISDHHIVSCTINITPLRRLQTPRWIKKYGQANWTGISKDLENLLSKIRQDPNNQDVETLWRIFKESLTASIDNHIPKKKTKKIRKLPYITPEIEKLIRRRNRIYKKLNGEESAFNRSTQANIDRDNKLRNLKKEIQRKMRQAHWNYIDSIFTPAQENETSNYQGMKRFWQYIKINRKDQHGISTLKANGKISSTPKEKANALNRQFQSVFNEKQDPPNNLLEVSTHPTSPDIIISTQGISKLLQKLKPHKAAGPDELPARILREMAPQIAPILHVIFQRSYDSGKIPDDWKNARVVPVYKKGATQDPANYRPISLTCISCKIMEHIIASNIMKHARANNIIYQLQHGFLDRRSCETQLLEFQTDILKNLEKGQQSDVLIMDFSKAFDKVSHQHLLQKLEYYGVRTKTSRWISEFLSDRKQCVVVDGETSDQVPVTSGVPQGSVLGPPLFLYYINDIAQNLSSTVRLFADDTIAYLTINSKEDSKILQKDLNTLELWETKWLMEFHPQKCQVLSITKNRRPIQHQYTLHGHVLENVKDAKYLGVTISNDFRWSKHIDIIISKASQNLGFLRRNLQISSKDIKSRAYKAIVRPLLEYSPCIWDPSTSKDIDRIEMIQRRAARFVSNRYHNTSSVNDMLKQLQWPTLQERRQHARLTMLYKIVNTQVDTPGLLSNFTPNSRPSRHNNSKSYHIPDTAKSYVKDSFIPRTIREWNNLPEDTVTAKSIDSFKHKLCKNHNM